MASAGEIGLVQRALGGAAWERLSRMRRQRRIQTATTFGLAFLGPLLAVATYLAFGPLSVGGNTPTLRLILLADTVYVLVVAALVLSRVTKLIAARRRQSAGSLLHMRLSAVFSLVALVPTVLVAVFAVLTVNIGLEGWFSDRVRSVVGTSLAAAESYERQSREDLLDDAVSLAAYLNTAKKQTFLLRDGDLRPLLSQGQSVVQRGLKEAYLIDGAGNLMTRGERSYLFDYEKPSPRAIELSRTQGPQAIPDWDNNEYRALVHLEAFADRYLYISRVVDGQLLSLLDDTQATVRVYNQLEAERGKVLFNFGLLYLGFALILILASTWVGLWFAERLSRPVGRLAAAAARVGEGDLQVQVKEEPGTDEIAMLGRIFNQMTQQLRLHREELVASHQETEGRRRLFDSVLSNVTAGVIGLNPAGAIEFVNRAGARLLDMESKDLLLSDAVPEFAALFERLREANHTAVQEELRLTRKGKLESLLVRMSERRNEEGALEGYVVAFDDVTDLVSAQRMAAWGDVARRIAHEIKNPLTPIALSAERIKRKFGKQLQDPADLEQYTDVIIRQTNDLRRIVDEFSKFARMPEPDRRETDLTRLLRDAVILQESGQPNVRFKVEIPEGAQLMDLDGTMINQALTNLIKNAGEAIESFAENGKIPGFIPEIHISLIPQEDAVEILIADNGIGLPPDRARLFEPYVTTREKGTGLGLPIVKKIIEEHGGTLALLDAPIFDGNTHAGAMAEIRLPRLSRKRAKNNLAATGQGG